MTQHDPLASLRQMLDFALDAAALAAGKSRADLEEDRTLRYALLYSLQSTGEAAVRVPPEERERLTRIPWTQIVGMRHRLVHGYDVVDLDVVLSVARTELGPLVSELRRALGFDP